MTDQELLVYAANAVEIKFDAEKSKPHPSNGIFWWLWLIIDGEPYEGQRRRWNSLKNNDDAFQLAVKLGIDIIWNRASNSSYEEYLAIARRAIVKAAAKIGELYD